MRWCALALVWVVVVSGCVSLGQTEVYFCPEDDCLGALVRVLGSAEESIHCAVYIITVQELADVLVDKRARGLDVGVVMEGDYTGSKYSKYEYLRDNGVGVVRKEGEGSGEEGEEGWGQMHNKFCVVDGEVVITGSANWSGNGMWRNNENVLVVRDKGVAEKYDAEFRNLWESEGLYR